MDRRDFVTLAAAISAAGALTAVAADKHEQHSGPLNKAPHMVCAEACSDCQRMCANCTQHCTHQVSEGKKEHLPTLKSCQDCAEVCAVAASIVARGGPYTADICRLCAEVCAKCATECEKFANDTHMKMCAEECRKCEAACRKMLSA